MSTRSLQRNVRITASIIALLIVGSVFQLFAPVAIAAPNYEINYQGKLTDSADAPVADGAYEMEFNLYTAVSGGTAVWTESFSGINEVTVTDGLFSVMLGSLTSLATVDFNQTLYLGVTIESDSEMTPRKVLGAVPAAFVADTLDGLDSTQFVRTDAASTIATSSASTLLTITQSGSGDILNLFDGSNEVFTVVDGGNVGIGTTSPYAKLSVSGQVVGEYFTATSTAATSTFAGNVNIGGNVSLFGVYGDSWTDFCISITGSAGLCDGSDAGAGSGSGTVSTSTVLVDTYITYATGEDTVGGEASFTYDDATDLLTVVNAVATNATTTSLGLNNETFTDLTGTGLQNVGGVLTVTTSGDWTGTLDGQEGSYYLANAFSTTSADYWETQQTARTADDLTNNSIEDLSDVATMTKNYGDLLFWNGSAWTDTATSSLGLATAFTATYPIQYSGNVLSLAFGTTTDNTWAGTQTFGDLLSTNASTTNFAITGLTNALLATNADGTVISTTTIGANLINTSGNWTGTFDSQEGTYYLDRANHTGTQLAATISDFDTTARGLFSSSATGLTYTSGTGVFTLTSGYTIPLAASTTEWDTAYGWGDHSAAGYENTLTFTYPLSRSADTISLAFGTTTSNTWAGTQTFGNLLATNATTTSLGLNNETFTDLTGTGLANVGGVLTVTTSGDWTGTFDGQEGSYYLANSFSTTSADYWETQQTARTADDLTNNSIEDLSDVAAMTENYGDLLMWNGSAWSDVATSSLGISGSSYTFTYPLIDTLGTVSLAFGTTTANSWSDLQTFGFASSTGFSSAYASSTNAFIGTLSVGSLTGPLQAINGEVSATSTLSQVYGGTGLSSYTAGDILYVNSSGDLAKLPIGAPGEVLKATGGLPAWGTDLSGGGGAGGTWATTTSQVAGILINYPNNASDVAAIGSNSTTTAEYWFDPTAGISYLSGRVGIGTTSPSTQLSVQGNGLFSGNVTAANITATGTVTALSGSFTDATTTSFGLNSETFTDLTGTGLQNVGGLLTINATGDWTGTFDGQEGSYYLANSFSTTSADYWETQQTARTADDLTNNSIEDLSDVAAMTENYGDLLMWNGSAWSDVATSSLGLATAFTATYPIQYSGNVLSLAFGTTTSNTWAGTQTFTNAPVLGALSGVLYGNNGILNTSATSTATLGLGLSGTLTTLGSSDILSIATSSLFSGTAGQVAYFDGTNSVVGTSSLFVATSGNVGIGTTSPGFALDTTGYGRFTSGIIGANGSTGIRISRNVSDAASASHYVDVAYSGISATTNNQFVIDIIRQGASKQGLTIKTSGVTGSSIERFKIDGEGNVGIGTTNPLALLHVSTTTTATDVFRVDAGSSQLVVNATGNLGIGTTSPFARLSVGGNTYIGGTLTATGTVTFTALSDGLVKSTAGVLAAATAGTDYENPLTFTYPLSRSTNTISLAFGTTTSNTWAGTQTFTNAPVLGALSGVIYGNNGTLGTAATSSLAVSGPFTISGTLGALLGGSNSTITYTGLATTSQPSSSQLLVSNGGAGVYGVSTSTATLGLGLSGSITGLGGSNSLSIATSSLFTGTTGQVAYFDGTNSLTGTSTIFIGTDGKVGVNAITPTGIFQVNKPSGYTLDQVPTMTSNSAPSGTVSCSSAYVTSACYFAFDEAIPGGWVTNSSQTGWLRYQFPSGKVITKYTIVPWSVDTQPATNRSPKTWTFEGSNDGSSWTVLDTQTNYTNWLSYTKRSFEFSNSTSYTYYRLNVSANGGNAYMGIEEMEMMEGTPEEPGFVLDTTGNFGIGTTSPYAKLSVMGTVVSDNFNATSTSATSTFAGGFSAGSNFYVLQNGKVGIGTTSPYAKLSVVGDVVAANFTATTTATSTFPTLSVTGRLYDGAGTGGANGYVLQSTGSGTQWMATSSLGLASAFTATYPIQYSGNVLSLAFGTTTSNTWAGTQTFTNAPVLGALSGVIYGNNGTLNTAATSTATLGLGLSGTLTTLGSSDSLTIATSSLFSGTQGQVAYFDGTNSLVGTSSLAIGTNEYVGLGTTTPERRLHLLTATSTDGILVERNSNSVGDYASIHLGVSTLAGSKGGIFFERTASNGRGTLHLSTVGDTTTGTYASPTHARLSITSVGDVGIGTTTPNYGLHVLNTGGVGVGSGDTSLATGESIGKYSFYANDASAAATTEAGSINLLATEGWGGSTSLSSRLAFNSILDGTVMEMMTIGGSNGVWGVGIGTSSPFAELSVGGDAYIGGNITATGTITGVNGSFTNATTSVLNIGGLTSALLLADAEGDVAEYAGTSCTNQFVRSLSVLGAATCATVGTADVAGLDISDDTNLAATYPIVLTGDTLSLAFGTTTSNTWAGTQTFTNAPVLGALSGVIYGNNGTLNTAATSTATLGLGLSGTLTTLGSSDSLTIATSSLFSGTQGQVAYFDGTNSLVGTSSLFVGSNGKIGIGTTTPGHALSIVSATNNQLSIGEVDGGGFLNIDVNNGGTADIIYGGSGNVRFGNNGAVRMEMSSTGIQSNTNHGWRLAWGSSQSETTPVIIPNENDLTTGFASGVQGNINAIVGGLELMRWTSAGIGIGTTSPFARLSVGGNAYIGGNLTATGTLTFNDETFNDFTGSGLTLLSNALTVDDVAADMLASADFGDFTCNGTTCSLDADTVSDNEIDYSTVTLSDFTDDVGFLSDITGESLEDLSDVASMTKNYGDLLFWNGSAWADIATSSLGIAGSGSGTVSSGLSGYFGYYPGDGTTIDDQTILSTDGTNIGIGTTSPYAKLAVVGGGTGTDHAFIVTNSSGDALFSVQDNGYVGVGTSAPAFPLSFAGFNSSVQFRLERTGSFTGKSDIGADQRGLIFWGGGYDGGTPDVTFASTSRVGIGIEDPVGKLHVYDATDSSIYLTRTDATSAHADWAYNGAYMTLGTRGTDSVVFKTVNTSRLSIGGDGGNDGDVGIGTGVNPYSDVRLAVVGETADDTTATFGLYDSNSKSLFTTLNDGLTGVGTSSPYAKFAIHANNGETSTTLFAIASSTASATTTLFAISNQGIMQLPQNPGDSTGTSTIMTIGGKSFLTAGSDLGNAVNQHNLGLGIGALGSSNSVFSSLNTAIGSYALASTTGGSARDFGNTAVGYNALRQSRGANILDNYYNSAFGAGALTYNITGARNVAVGAFTSAYNTSATSTVAIGYRAACGSTCNGTTGVSGSIGYTVVGDSAGTAIAGGHYNTLFGYQSGSAITSGISNVLIGPSVTANNLTTGHGNIGIGSEIFFPSATGNNQLNIGGLVFGTLPATSTALKLPTTGAIGIGTTSPFAKLSVHANNGDTNTTLFAIGSSTASATTTLFSISNTGVAAFGDPTSTQDASFQLGPDANAWTAGYYAADDSFRIASSTDLTSNIALAITKTAGAMNVGIGTTSPWQEFAVSGDISVTGRYYDTVASAGLNGYVLQSTGSGTQWVATSTLGITGGGGGSGTVSSGLSGYFAYYSGDGTTVDDQSVLNISGTKIGVSTSSPYAKFSVHALNGETNTTLFSIASSTASATTTLFSVSNTGLTTVGNPSGTGDATFQFASDANAWGIGYFASDKSFRIASSTDLSTNAILTITKNGTNKVGIGTTTPVSTLSIQGSLCVRDTGSCGTTAGTIYATTASLSDIDLAENYRALDETLSAGEIVSLDSATTSTIKRAEKGETILGVVSTAPGLLLGQDIKDGKPVALKGRIPVKINMEGGKIEVGDAITLSSEAGIGMKATSTAYAVGLALEATSTPGTIEVFVQNQTYFSPEDRIGLARLIALDDVLFSDDVATSSLGLLAAAENNEDTMWSKIMNLAKNFVDGVLTVAGIRTEQLCVGDVCIDEATFLQMVQQAGGTPVVPTPTPEPTPTPTPDDGEGDTGTGVGDDADDVGGDGGENGTEDSAAGSDDAEGEGETSSGEGSTGGDTSGTEDGGGSGNSSGGDSGGSAGDGEGSTGGDEGGSSSGGDGDAI